MDLQYCYMCGGELKPGKEHALICQSCGRVLFKNPKPAVAIVLFSPDGKMILSVRGIDPAKGKLDTLGGFVDMGETFEEALYRELEEEAGLKKSDISDVEYIGSVSHPYTWGPDEVEVLSAYYRGVIKEKPAQGYDDVESFVNVDLEKLDVADMSWGKPMYDMLQLAAKH